MKNFIIVLLFSLFTSISFGADPKVVDFLQSISVTVATNTGSGSGVIVTREVKVGDKKQNINFVFTAAHVVDSLRSIRTVIEDGKEKKLVEFKSPKITKNIVEDGRTIGRLQLDAKVLKYSDSENGTDLAILMILKRDFIKDSAKFTLGDKIIPIGTDLLHVGSLLGQDGANSLTSGMISQVGRVLDLGNSQGKLFDQTTVTAFPGSSGGGVFTTDGTYIGMLVRGAGETFNFITPSRRINEYLDKNNLTWLVDPTKPVPTLDEINKFSVEGQGNLPAHGETSKDSPVSTDN